MSRPIIDMRGIVKSFYVGTPNELEILHGLDIVVPEGQFVSIVGASGSGKSTLLYMLSGLDTVTSGTIKLDGAEISNMKEKNMPKMRRNKIGFVFQSVNHLEKLLMNYSLKYRNMVL